MIFQLLPNDVPHDDRSTVLLVIPPIIDAAWLAEQTWPSDHVTKSSDVIVYCGSGVNACHDLLALERCGFDPLHLQLYAGSWSQWASEPSRPAAIGDLP